MRQANGHAMARGANSPDDNRCRPSNHDAHIHGVGTHDALADGYGYSSACGRPEEIKNGCHANCSPRREDSSANYRSNSISSIISNIFPPVGGVFQVLIDFTPFDYLACVSTANFEQLSQSSMLHIISFIFQ